MISLANNDWTIIPVNDLPARLFNYGWLLAALCTFNLLLYLLFYVAFYYYVPEIKELESSKILYTLKNLSKSLELSILVFMTAPKILQVIMYDEWNNDAMFFWGTVYVSIDLLGLLVVPGLQRDTKIHHTVVCILGTISAISDYRFRGLHQALLALTYLSAVPYIVNTYLGLRHLNNKKLQEGLISACFYVYAISILLNFWIQHMYVFYLIPGGLTVAKLCYLFAYYLILKDDIHLMGYFRYKVKDPSVTSNNNSSNTSIEKLDNGDIVQKEQDTMKDGNATSKVDQLKETQESTVTPVVSVCSDATNTLMSVEKNSVTSVKKPVENEKEAPESEKETSPLSNELSNEHLNSAFSTTLVTSNSEDDAQTPLDNDKKEEIENQKEDLINKPKKSRFNLDFFMQLISKNKIETK